MTTWLITGCSSGLGRHLAQAVLAKGQNVVVTARDPETVRHIVAPYPDTSLALALDVTDAGQIAGAIEQANARFGGIDVLVNNAGYGYRAAVEEGDEADVASLFATNFFGAVALIKAALPGMRARKFGAIVNISSLAARRTSPGSSYYAATKRALDGLSDGLRKEVAPLGIRVLVVEPSSFRTEFAGRSLKQAGDAIGDYAKTAGARRKENDTSDGQQTGDPAKAAQAIIRAVEDDNGPFRLLLGSKSVDIVRAEIRAQLAEIDAWESVSTGTDIAED